MESFISKTSQLCRARLIGWRKYPEALPIQWHIMEDVLRWLITHWECGTAYAEISYPRNIFWRCVPCIEEKPGLESAAILPFRVLLISISHRDARGMTRQAHTEASVVLSRLWYILARWPASCPFGPEFPPLCSAFRFSATHFWYLGSHSNSNFLCSHSPRGSMLRKLGLLAAFFSALCLEKLITVSS